VDWTLVRIDQGGAVKKFDSKMGGSRTRGRPRLRWLENVEKDILEKKVKRWEQKVGRL